MNDYSRLSARAAVALGLQICETIGAGAVNEYGVPQANVQTLSTQADSVALKNVAVEEAKAAYHAAVADRDQHLASCVKAISTVAGFVFANPANSTAKIRALGIVPHSGTRTRVVPVTPASLLVAPVGGTEVRLDWDRLSNPKSVSFLVEGQDASGGWRLLGVTTAAKMSLVGYAPGETTNFRVSASRNGIVSLPSTIATLYPTGIVPALRLAA